MPYKEVSVVDLKARIDSGEDLFLLDVREPHEREIANIGGTLIPMGEIADRLAEIPRDREVIVYCRSGGRSERVVRSLEAHSGFTNLVNLRGGILAWADQVDSSLTKY